MSLPHPDAKRKMVRDGFVRDYGELILQYDKLLQIIPDPCVPSSKRTWERQMYHVRAVARHVQDCHETGNRASLHNYLLSKFETLFADKVEYRFMVPELNINQHAKVGSRLLHIQLRSAQYEYWLRGQDLWTATGSLVKWFMAKS